MHTHNSAHNHCAKVLESLRTSGLHFTLRETPYSAYLTIRKKFIKEFTPSQNTAPPVSDNITATAQFLHDYKDLKDALAREKDQHNLTKYQLSLKLKEHAQASEVNLKMGTTIDDLKKQHAQEVEDHTNSENALRKLEAKLETNQEELAKANTN